MDFGSDNIDEFEFKPLSEGLGFHKKKSKAPLMSDEKRPSTMPPVSFNKNILKDSGLDLLEEEKTFQSPLPRHNELRINKKTSSNSINHNDAVNEILNTLQKTKRLDFTEAKKELKSPQIKTQYVSTIVSIPAILLDSLLILATSLLCMIVALAVTKVDIISQMTNPLSDPAIYFATGLLLVGVTAIYLIINRVFMGCTPGEWAYDQIIGQPKDQNTISYIGKVILRTFFVIATGFFISPLISFVLNKDILGSITKAPLLKKT